MILKHNIIKLIFLKEERVNNAKESEPKEKKVEMKGFQRNEIKENNTGFELGNKMDNVEHLSQKIII